MTTALAAATLDDKYVLESGRVFLTGIQALVRLPLMQRRRDLAAGLNTAGYISGYRGSPLGGYDQQLWRARKFLEKQHVVFQPGLNEALAMTAVLGSQQLNIASPGARYDGVFSIWYGKFPGVDQSADTLRIGNAAGSAKNGGVLILCGDDHGAVSSALPHGSEHNMVSFMLPFLNPAGVQDYLDYGLLGWAMSRYSGAWVGFKAVTELVESSASVHVDPARLDIATPTDFEMPPGGLNVRWPEDRYDQEKRLFLKWRAAQAFARANRIDRLLLDSPRPRFGIVSTGKGLLDVQEALDALGIDAAAAAAMGLRFYKVGMPIPLEPEGARRFADGLEEVLVVEEKRSIIEAQLKDLLFHLPAGRRPRVVGKTDEQGAPLVPESGELTPALVARLIWRRFGQHVPSPQARRHVEELEAEEQAKREASNVVRLPYFCSGCPHNTSTKVPEGSRATAGIGCHWMASWMNRNTTTYTQMGAEGISWLGQAPFTEEKHVFANLGDGTYFHSGILAIRAAVAAKANVTYKILFNDAVAMTGGQPHDGPLTPWQISRQVAAEGVARVLVATDEPDKYPVGTPWADGVTVHHRRELDGLQRELRETPGVTVLIYDQTCAAEKRRRRKRGAFPDPDRRIFINDLVCEGCGDCSKASNCVSVEPLETEFGRKRKINQSSCNKDFSCVEGFCPSFVSVSGGRLRRAKPAKGELDAALDALPAPERSPLARPYNVLVTGVGGTGVITVGALLGMAAHLEGKGVSVLDNTGLSQKGGAVMSHVRIAPAPEDLHAVRIADGHCDLLLGCDVVVSSGAEAIRKLKRGASRAIVNGHLAPIADFTLNPDAQVPEDGMRRAIREAAGDNLTEFVDATQLATAVMGDAIATNLFMLGYAFQRGLVPLSPEAVERAIELNDVSVEASLRTFRLGRLAAHDLGAVERAARPQIVELPPPSRTLDDLIERRAAFLADYQNAAYAERYRAFVRKVEAAERERAMGRTGLAEAVAHGLFKLMAYKDEYEVARLYAAPDFARRLSTQFEGEVKLTFHLAPPLFARRDPATGRLQKADYGSWVMSAFRLLARLKGLRGTAFDPFGRTAERRMERRLIEDYRASLEQVIGRLDEANHALALEIARLPERMRGFGHVKEANVAQARRRGEEVLAAFLAAPERAAAAE
jgi:indolepyruvate ferredoxin oxidoreductase